MSSPQQCHFPCLYSTLPSKAGPFLLKQNQKNERTKRKRLFHLTIAMTVDFKLYATLMSWNLVGRVSFQHGASVHLSVKPHLSLMQICSGFCSGGKMTLDILHKLLIAYIRVWPSLSQSDLNRIVLRFLKALPAKLHDIANSHVHLIFESGKSQQFSKGKKICKKIYVRTKTQKNLVNLVKNNIKGMFLHCFSQNYFVHEFLLWLYILNIVLFSCTNMTKQ